MSFGPCKTPLISYFYTFYICSKYFILIFFSGEQESKEEKPKNKGEEPNEEPNESEMKDEINNMDEEDDQGGFRLIDCLNEICRFIGWKLPHHESNLFA